MQERTPVDDSAETRDKILSIAARLFAEQGYENTPLSQVAREATVSKALIFWHFDSKDKLYRAALRRTLEPYFIDVGAMEGLGAAEQVERLLDLFYDFVRENGNSVRFLFHLILQEESRRDEVASRVRDLYGLFRGMLADVIREGQRSGELREDPDPVLEASLVLAALDGVLIEHFLDDHRRPDPAALIAHLKRTTLERLRFAPSTP